MPDPGQQDRFTAPVIKALGLHLLVLLLLFVSFSTAPEFEPAKPIVQATLVQLNSKSPATTQTDQKIAGEAERTAAQRHEAEELKRRQEQQQQEQEAARRAAAEQERQAAASAAAAAKAAEDKAAEERRQAEQVERQKAEEAKRKADAAKKLAEEEAAKKAAEEAARRKAAEEAEAKRKEEEARRRAAEEAKRKADEAAKKAEADRVARLKREQEEAKAKALADLLASETQYQRAQADQVGDEVAASYDDVIRRYVSEQWRRPPTARNGMVVEVRISMLPSGDITDAVILRSSGDAGFDQSALQAVRNVGRIPEMQQLSRESPATFDRLYRQRTLRFKPEDLAF